jgi:hypothetical protein
MITDKPAAIPSARPIHTFYYRDNKVVRVTASRWANNAVPRCIWHMQLNDYGATSAEVVDSITGDLHAVIHHNVVGKIHIIFKREVKGGM